jgi:DNA processing protein
VQELSWFWSGAVMLPVGGFVEAAGVRAGGLGAVDALDADALIDAGVPPDLARSWRAARPVVTRGLAVRLCDLTYPPLLATLRRPPPVLFVEGAPDALLGRGLGVVGTRACTAYGRAVARHLGSAAAAAGLVVVSGLARGIDAEAHRAAAEAGRTVAVLGHGLSFTAPPSNRRLRERIVERDGAIVSVWPDDVEPRPYLFPARNRFVAGLCEAVVVVEAGEGSGALITARDALSAGRDVFAVPAPLGAPAGRGCLELLGEGAGVIVDVEAFVAGLVGGRARAHDAWVGDLFAGLPIDEVARRHGRSASELVAEITRLELEGRVVRQPGQRYGPGRGGT